MYSVEALHGREKPGRVHVFELVGEDQVDGGLMVCVVGEVHVECVGADILILCRVHSCEVLVLDEYRAMCRRQWGEGEWALKVLAGRGVVEVDGVSVEDVGAVGCCGIDVLVVFAGVERGIVVVADGEGDYV